MVLLHELQYLRASRASRDVMFAFVRDRFWKLPVRKYYPDRARFREFIRSGEFTHDWFSNNIPTWMRLFDKFGLRRRPVRILEIGSFEGLSTCFILQHLPQARLVCVDAWSDPDGYSKGSAQRLEAVFDRNVTPWRGRLEKRKSSSAEYFKSELPLEQYDLIYVDGSHRPDDVALDAQESFARLRIGGLLIFDDYLWRNYPQVRDNPATAIHNFLHAMTGRYRVECVNYQLVISKLR